MRFYVSMYIIVVWYPVKLLTALYTEVCLDSYLDISVVMLVKFRKQT